MSEENLVNKTCSTCNNSKNIQYFEKRKTSKDGYRSQCKLCRNESKAQYYKDNKENILKKSREYCNNNKEKINNRSKEYAAKNKEAKKEYNKEYRIKNQEKLKANSRKYYEENKEVSKEKSKEYRLAHVEYYKEYNKINCKKYYKTRNKEVLKIWYENNKDKINKNRRDKTVSANSKISNLVRDRIRHALKSQNGEKYLSSIKLLGCSIKFYKEYLESKFTKGMNWENNKFYGWHIDHIIPCNSFDLTDPEQQKICFHYTNTQPLWATTKIAISHGEDSSYIGNLEKSYIFDEVER